jgi:hypothetical protein
MRSTPDCMRYTRSPRQTRSNKFGRATQSRFHSSVARLPENGASSRGSRRGTDGRGKGQSCKTKPISRISKRKLTAVQKEGYGKKERMVHL